MKIIEETAKVRDPQAHRMDVTSLCWTFCFSVASYTQVSCIAVSCSKSPGSSMLNPLGALVRLFILPLNYGPFEQLDCPWTVTLQRRLNSLCERLARVEAGLLDIPH